MPVTYLLVHGSWHGVRSYLATITNPGLRATK
jgi:hypothetical protein